MACNRPWMMKDKNGRFVAVPCGWCMQCRIDKRNEWTMRLDFEVSKRKGSFVTLTYDDLHLPSDLGLHKDHVQNFLKRLRKFYPPRSISYYAVGEYGEQGNVVTGLKRPHYHLILIGDGPIGFGRTVKESWPFGFVLCKPAQKGSISYVLKYMDKQIHGAEALVAEYGDKQPPFALMSKGLGLSYMAENIERVEHFGGIPYNGKVRPIPRYYLDRFNLSNVVNQNKRAKVLEYMESHNCTYEKALNDLGRQNEVDLESNELLHRK